MTVMAEAMANMGHDVHFLSGRVKSRSRIKIVYRVAGLYLFETSLEFHPNLKNKIEFLLMEVDLVNFNSVGMRELFFKKISKYFHGLNFRNELLLDVGVKSSFANKQWLGFDKSVFTLVMVAKFGAYAKRQDLLIEAFGKWAKDCLCTDSEGLSKSIAEAMSIGVPLLVSNVSAINTYITNNENGILVDNTVEAWVLALDKMYNASKQELEALSEREIAYAKEHFDVEINAKKYIEAFESLVQS